MRRRTLALGAAASVGGWVMADLGAGLVRPEARAAYSTLYPAMAQRRLAAWEALPGRLSGLPLAERLTQTNQFFNQLRFLSDGEQWGSRDYWATPLEFLGRGAGDCEEFAIAKYVTLVKSDVPTAQLRITYVKALRPRQAHMVLTWAPKSGDMPLVLDNLIAEIRPASARTDLIPVYSFNADSLWISKVGSEKRVSDASNVGHWQDLRRRMAKEIIL